ncbi:MAG: DUF1800 domain-containing protein [Chthonomonadales bacterium]
MKLRRREALQLGAVAGAGVALTGCSAIARRFVHTQPIDSVRLPAGDVSKETRLINRVSYGPIPGEVARIRKIGAENYLTEQLHPKDNEPDILSTRLASLEALQINASELGDQPEEEITRQLQMATLLYAVYSPHQLRERMVEFWTNHFNIYSRKGEIAYDQPTDLLQVLRTNALGKFPDLLRTSAHSPAMLQYLDNQVNRKKDTKGAGANENYARELLELHTLGVHGGYTQKDVQEVARCLTGWTVEDRFMHARGTFRFDADSHDTGAKTVLGIKIAAGHGVEDGDKVLDIVSRHPMTAKFVSYKICRFFLGDGADAWSDKMAEIYLKTGGDITQMLRPMLLSAELVSGPPVMKRPYDYSVSALRALNVDTNGDLALHHHLERMGMPLYQWPMPDGYPDRTSAWTGSLLARWNFAFALTTSGIHGTDIRLSDVLEPKKSGYNTNFDNLYASIFGEDPASDAAAEMRERLKSHREPERLAALLISSPEFQWR